MTSKIISFGIGIDMEKVSRFCDFIRQDRKRFCARVFTSREMKDCGKKPDYAVSLAARFATKEAVKKALAEFRHENVPFNRIEIFSNERGQPNVLLHGLLESFVVKVSLSHTAESVIAVALVWRKPKK